VNKSKSLAGTRFSDLQTNMKYACDRKFIQVYAHQNYFKKSLV